MDAKGARALVERLAREGRYADGALTDGEPDGSAELVVAELAGDAEPLAPSPPAAERAA